MDITQGQLFNFISGSHVEDNSNYAIWKSLGNEGNQADFLEAIKGDKGDKGDDGEGSTKLNRTIDVLFSGVAGRHVIINFTKSIENYDFILVVLAQPYENKLASNSQETKQFNRVTMKIPVEDINYRNANSTHESTYYNRFTYEYPFKNMSDYLGQIQQAGFNIYSNTSMENKSYINIYEVYGIKYN